MWVYFDCVELYFMLDILYWCLSGDVWLIFIVMVLIDVLVLDLDCNLLIVLIMLGDQLMVFSNWSNLIGWLCIVLLYVLVKGEMVSVGICYGGVLYVVKNVLWDGGFVWSIMLGGKFWVVSVVEGEGCDLFWLCIDQFIGKLDLVDIWVIVFKDFVVFGNGVLVSVEDYGVMCIWYWCIKCLDIYVILINVGFFKEFKGNYVSCYGNIILMEFWYLFEYEVQVKKLFVSFMFMFDFFEQEIGLYLFGDEKMGVVEILYKGMEYQIFNVYGNYYVKDGYGYDWLLQYEFVYEWFGNQVINVNWDDMWLYEGFGIYMQLLYVQYFNGDMDYYVMFYIEWLSVKNVFLIVLGKLYVEYEVYDVDCGLVNDIYFKGLLVLYILCGLIGDDVFFQSICELVYGCFDLKFGNFQLCYVIIKDYIDIVKWVIGKDYGWFFQVYLYDVKLL